VQEIFIIYFGLKHIPLALGKDFDKSCVLGWNSQWHTGPVLCWQLVMYLSTQQN